MANIKVFARLKPSQNINQELFKREDHALYISTHRRGETNAEISARRAEDSKWLRFRFAHVFGIDSSQKNVFDVAAKDIVEAFLEGYNGTIFAYGQTGAGKTYTIRGDDGECRGFCNASENLGLIPQSLSLIFQTIQQYQNESISLYVSFLDIYKEAAYDLLGPLLFRDSRKMKELPKVLVTMGGTGSSHLHGLSCHHVMSEKDAARLYHLGIANHKIAETSTDQRSSRSHTIFTIVLSRQRHGAEIIFRSKLHLVDLAGSQKVWKSSGTEQQPIEPRFINLSLLHLESVIIALQKFSVRNVRTHSKKRHTAKCLNRSSSAILSATKSMDGVQMQTLNMKLRSVSAVDLGNCKGSHSLVGGDFEPIHVPYRNSLLTMVLQDSLGGNCNAVMIAVLSVEEKNLYETISTCRFAQRVARVTNTPMQNEEVDKDAVIKRLQSTLAKLYLELATYQANEQDSAVAFMEDGDDLVDEQECVAVMQLFRDGRISDPVAHGINTPRKFRTSLHYLRQLLTESSTHQDSADERDSGVRTSSEPASPLASEGENENAFGAARLTAQLRSLPVTSTDTGSEHRSSITQESGISLGMEHEEHRLEPTSFTAQSSRPGSSDVSTQTSPLVTAEGRQIEKNVCADEGRIKPTANSKDGLWTWELELQKETLLNKSKMFASRLADQRARLVLMLRQGAVPEDLENEKIVELQLQKKQREVENKLSLVVKKLVDLNYTDRLLHPHEEEPCFEKQATSLKEDLPLTFPVRSIRQEEVGEVRALTQSSKELQLKEEATRQKLLALREQMRNFGFSSPAVLLGMTSKSSSSASSVRSGTGQASSSAASSVTLFSEEERKIAPTPPSKKGNIVVKPPKPKSRIGCSLLPANRTASNCRGEFLRRSLSKQETLPRKDKCMTTRRDVKRATLADYMNSSRQTLYLKSTFPRRIEIGIVGDKSGVNKTTKIAPKRKEGNCRDSETSLSESGSGGCLQLNEKSSAKPSCVPGNITKEVKEETSLEAYQFTEQRGELGLESKDLSYENRLPAIASGKENTRDQNSTDFNRDETERVKKIRVCVNAAEVIQRTWRLYKQRGNGESKR